MRKFLPIGAIVCALSLLLSPVPVAGLPAENLKSKIKDASEDLDNANAQVKTALTQYRKAAAALPAAEARLERAKAALAKARNADSAAAGELQEATNQTSKAENKLLLTKVNLSSQELEVAQLVRNLYIQGPTGELAIVLGADSAAELTARVEAVSRWNTSKELLIAKLMANREALTVQTEQLKILKAKKEQKKQVAEERVLTAAEAAAEAAAAQKKVDSIVAKREAALAVAKKYRNAVLKRYKALKAEQERLRKLAEGIDDGGVVGGNDLLWPISGGRISGYTGWRVHPVYGYRSCHTGIDIAASSGTPIRSSEDGVVATVGNGGPYGRYTLVSHGDGLTTFYAHQSSQLVSKGDKVKRGETIGRVGSTGWSTGPHLHFEVRINGVPYNPMGWFGSSKSKVSCVD